MDQIDLFKKYFNNFLLENSEKMLSRALIISTLNENCYLLMNAFKLCEYEDDRIVFYGESMKNRIERLFNEVMKYSYTISKPSDFFTNEYDSNFDKKFDFIRKIPDDYYLKFNIYQKKLYEYYWNNLNSEKKFFFSEKTKKYIKINGEAYANFLHFSLGKEFSIVKTKGNFIIKKYIKEDTYFFIEINTKCINKEIEKYGRLPPFPIFIIGGMYIDSYQFIFNRIDHPAIENLGFQHGLYQEGISSELKWLFILCDISAYYIKMCFDFYEESLLSYIKKYS
ncbi:MULTISPECIES: hypothetical protein [Acinetobacter]|uniref:Uncharacterized protein n=1 Tax=Acinetobacter baylyi (strain ATCC 33305 / BD413 / ADP1) TaxID=62977 RepID=Q6F906_ACIAD|nr:MULTISPECIES: hypothetical protein [Acinetobacter]ENV53383.1 hypothetical protein F952_02444 [Acinetobacter baylyi DSM 14961 = CIP 107474]KAF2370737.1 hypothetical protein BSL88_08970 [Acinetobacter baylyi]KAF2375125.1 hypothetical protein BSL67_02170 [Acinetobacter baylyi]KAF2378470.1 hypothetical protein BSN81_03450 [Acinetobacter baylyi]KAF2380037.1 hypothetical protein BSN83_12135 [Acinetobacter baylyi]